MRYLGIVLMFSSPVQDTPTDISQMRPNKEACENYIAQMRENHPKFKVYTWCCPDDASLKYCRIGVHKNAQRFWEEHRLEWEAE